MIVDSKREPFSGQRLAALDVLTPVGLRQAASIKGLAHRRLRDTSKRTIDIIFALLGLVLLAPVLVGVAASIRATSNGPALFWQRRIGRDNQAFWCCKFRTHYIHCCDTSGVHQTLVDDTRVTSLGRFLRRRSIDELPQLWNVLRGDMSMVGPRAHVGDMVVCGVPYEQAVERYRDRHQIRPGITGLAQVSGLRGPVLDICHAKKRVDLDLEYIERSCISLDLAIILRTVCQEISSGSGV